MNDDQISAARPVTGVQDLSRSQRMKRIHQEIALMRGMQPKILPFATCWNRLKQQKPELFQDMDDDNPPPTSLATTGQAHTDRGIANPSSLAAAMEVLRNYAQREVTVYGERPADGSVVVECLSGWSIWS